MARLRPQRVADEIRAVVCELLTRKLADPSGGTDATADNDDATT